MISYHVLQQYNRESANVCVFFRPEEARDIASKMLGKSLVTKQTGLDGRICNEVMVTTRMFPRKEFYLAVLLERTFGVS